MYVLANRRISIKKSKVPMFNNGNIRIKRRRRYTCKLIEVIKLVLRGSRSYKYKRAWDKRKKKLYLNKFLLCAFCLYRVLYKTCVQSIQG